MADTHRSALRPIITGLLTLMLLASLTGSLSARFGHADAPIAATAEGTRPVAAGDPAPRFVVRTVDGKAFDFDPRALTRPTVIITFRGGWCPYCNLHLSELRHVIPDIRALGVDVLFLSGDRPDALYEGLERETRETIDGLDYTILSDADAYAAVALGIAFRPDPSYVERLVDNGRDIEDSSIRRRDVMPVPAVFAIDVDGTVAWSYANPDYKIRVPADELLAVAKELAGR